MASCSRPHHQNGTRTQIILKVTTSGKALLVCSQGVKASAPSAPSVLTPSRALEQRADMLLREKLARQYRLGKEAPEARRRLRILGNGRI